MYDYVFVFQGTTFFAARYSYYEPHRVSWAELREDLHRRKAFRRISEGKFVKFAHLLRPRTSAKKYLVLPYLVPDTRVPGTTAVYVFCISRRHLLRPAPRTGTSSALGWDRLPSTVVA